MLSLHFVMSRPFFEHVRMLTKPKVLKIRNQFPAVMINLVRIILNPHNGSKLSYSVPTTFVDYLFVFLEIGLSSIPRLE